MSSGFVSEKELAEARLKRQEEWERVRTADQPLEVPEEKYDSRSLFERLDEQRKKRDLEFEESRKLKNMIKGLDDDEIDFLDLVDQKKLEAERKKTIDEERELVDYRNRVANLQEQSIEQRLQAEIKTVVNHPQRNIQSTNRLSQNQLLKGGLVIKKAQTQKRKLSTEDSSNESLPKKLNGNCSSNGSTNGIDDSEESSSLKEPKSALKCIGILPGLGYYTGDSSSDTEAESSDLEDVVFSKMKYDLAGRKIEEKKCEDS